MIEQEDVIQATEDVLEKMRDVLERMEEQQEVIAEQEILIAEKEEYIEQLTSSRHYVDLLVVILFSYIYGAWFGVNMCPK